MDSTAYCWRCDREFYNKIKENEITLRINMLAIGDVISLSLPQPICPDCIESFKEWVTDKIIN